MLSRRLMILSAVVSGLVVTMTVAVTIFTLLHIPDIEGLPVWRDGRIVKTDSKFTLLLAPLFFQLIIFGHLTWSSLRWEKFERRLLDQLETSRLSGAVPLTFDIGVLQKLMCIGAMGVEGLLLAFVFYMSSRLMAI